jgi:hypothetical protein
MSTKAQLALAVCTAHGRLPTWVLSWSARRRRAIGQRPSVDLPAAAMYIHRMVRTQLYLDDELHARLRDLARKQGRTVSDLVREALARVYGSDEVQNRLNTLDGIDGLWRGRRDLASTAAYVRRQRRDTRRSRKS